jgi:hypothetical protein
MNGSPNSLRSLVVGFYAWVTTVFFGVILLDIVYARLLRDALGAGERAAVFSEVSDALLFFGAVTIVAALGAIASSWNSTVVRAVLVASLIILGLEFATPVLALPFLRNAQELNIGPLLRLVPSGLASILALVALHQYRSQGTTRAN